MKSMKKRQFLILISAFGIGLLAACSGVTPTAGPGENDSSSSQEQEGTAATGLRTATPASTEEATTADTDPQRWQEVSSFQGTFTLTLERDLEEADLAMSWSQIVRSSRSATGTILLQRFDEDTWSGEGTVTWFVDDFIDVRDENGELIRTATAKGDGETLLDPGKTLLWMDLEAGVYGLAIYPAGLYEDMEVSGSEAIVGMETTDEKGPLGYLGLMDTAGIAGWFENLPLPNADLVLGGILDLPDGSVMTWFLEPIP